MAIRSGLAAQLGHVAESTYGTGVTVTRFTEFVDESLKLESERMESTALRAGRRVQRLDRWAVNKKGVSGDITYEVASKGFGLLLKHALGSLAITTPGGATTTRLHTVTLGDPWGLSMTVQVGRPDVGGTVQPFTYLGCKVTEWELSLEVDGPLMLKLTYDGRDEVTGTALATATYAASDELLWYTGATLTVGGSAVPVKKVMLKGTNGLKTDRYFINGSSLKSEPIAGELSEITGEIECEFNGLTDYNRFVNGTTAALVFTAEGSTIETTHKFGLTSTLPAVRFDGDTPNVNGTDITMLSLPFKVLDNGTDPPVSLAYKTTDIAA